MGYWMQLIKFTRRMESRNFTEDLCPLCWVLFHMLGSVSLPMKLVKVHTENGQMGQNQTLSIEWPLALALGLWVNPQHIHSTLFVDACKQMAPTDLKIQNIEPY